MAERTIRQSATRRLGAYAPLSAHYPDDDAILELDAEEDTLAELLFVRSLAYCARDTRLDGFISDGALSVGRVLRRSKRGAVSEAASRLVSIGLWTREANGYRITNWAKWNRTHEEIEARRGYDNSRKGALSKSVRDEVHARDEWRCVFCGSPHHLSVDHKIPLSAGGTHDLENLQTLCKSCNSSKGARQPKRPDASQSERRESAEEAQKERGPSEDSLTREAAAVSTATQGSDSDSPDMGPLRNLQDELIRNGINVSFDTDRTGLTTISDAIDRCGIPALVKHAKARHQPNNPAFSIRAYVAAFAALPARTVKLEAVTDPCPHGAAHWTRCSSCKAAAEAS